MLAPAAARRGSAHWRARLDRALLSLGFQGVSEKRGTFAGRPYDPDLRALYDY